MSDGTSFDLAQLDAWHGVRPGMTRPQVEEIMKQRGAETTAYDSDNLTAMTDEWEMEFYFSTDSSQRLRQLSIERGDVFWAGQPLLGVRLDEAWRALGSPASAGWRQEDEIADPSPTSAGGVKSPPTDEDLLAEGTVWLPERGLGLMVCDGEIVGIAWRAAQDLPTRYDGPVTQAQLELSKRPDLADDLAKKRLDRFKLEKKKDPLSTVRGIVTFAVIAALILVGKMGFDEMKLWNQAPTLQAKFVNVEQVPMKQFRDFLPPALRWMVPPTKPVIVEAYRVQFTPPGEELPQQVVLERGELYVPPQTEGDDVPIVHVPGNPPRTKGLSRARDSAFVDYMPWAIAIGALWLLAQFALGLLPAVLRIIPRLAKRLVPSGVIKDSNRPELR